MHRDLQTAATGLAVLAVALGVGRFILTPLLPLMQADAGLHLVTGGWLASVNNLGYLVGALACSVLTLPQRASLRTGLLAVAALTAAMGISADTASWLLWRGLTGIAAAVLMVHGTAFALSRLRHSGHRGLEALLFAGPGVGIVLSGVLIAALVPFGLHSQQAWIGAGLFTLLVTALVWPVTARPLPAPGAAAASPHRPADGPAWTLVTIYALLGFGYVIPATFLPLIADQQLHMPQLREWFWPVYGVSTVTVTLATALLPRHWSRRDLLGACCASMLAGTVLCLTWPSVTGLLLGTVLIGGVTMPVVLLVMGEARALAEGDPTRLIAVLTAGFSVGQIAGPPLAAALADASGSFHTPLLLAGASMLLALALSRIRHRHRAVPAACRGC